MRLSVCVVARNHGPLLPSLFRNVEDVAWEIVLVDGGSSDGTEEIARSHPLVRYHLEPWRGSITRQKNKALDLARGDWALILDCDERLSPDLKAALPGLMRSFRVRYYKFPRYNLVSLDPHRHVEGKSLYPDFQFRMLRLPTRLRYMESSPVHQTFQDPAGPGVPFGGIRKKLFMAKPRGLHIFHYDFYLHDREAREKKVEFFESLDPSAGLRRVYLYEDRPHRVVDTPPPWPSPEEEPRMEGAP